MDEQKLSYEWVRAIGPALCVLAMKLMFMDGFGQELMEKCLYTRLRLNQPSSSKYQWKCIIGLSTIETVKNNLQSIYAHLIFLFRFNT